MLLVFARSSRVRLDLHSFPTRRSSDLQLPRLAVFAGEELASFALRGGPLVRIPIETKMAPQGYIGMRTSGPPRKDRKSTRLNSSHANISYAVFCLKKQKHNSISRGFDA